MSSGEVANLRRVSFAAAIGSLAEYFDWGIAAPISALVWPRLFFPELSPAAALAASLATFGSVYLIRPVGAYLFGRFGDRRGRRAGLTWTLVAMGAGSVGLAVAPGYAVAGAMAPVILVAMRLVQGTGHGGEWGGASTWVAELASKSKRRAFWTGWITFAAPAGNLLASFAFFYLSLTMGAAFFSYGWRLLFATGAFVAVAGLVIRWRFVESPMYSVLPPPDEDADKGSTFFRTEWRRVLFLTLSFGFLSLVTGVLASTYGLSYLTTLGVSATSATQFGWMARIPGLVAFVAAALLADKKGRLVTLRIGTLLLLPSVLLFFPLLNVNTFDTTLLAFIMVEVPIDFASGSIAALFTESFPTRHRNRGAGLSYHSGALVSGVVLTVVVPLVVSSYGSVAHASSAITWMLFGLLTVSLLATLKVPETLHTGLLQSAAPTIVLQKPSTPPYDTT